MSLTLQNCKYQWQLNETLGEEFARLPWQTVTEFDQAVTILQASYQEGEETTKQPPDFSGLNNALQKALQRIIDYVDMPDNYISAGFVRENLSLFGLQEAELPQEDEEYYKAHQHLVIEIIKERAAHFASLSISEREELIRQQAAVRKNIENSQQILQSQEAPLPGSIKSTHQLLLTKILGGQQRFDAILSELKNDPRVSDGYAMHGNLCGVLIDEENLRWDFEITSAIGEASDKELLIVHVKNVDLLDLCPEKPDHKLARGQCASYEIYMSNTFPQGHYQLRVTTIADQLLTFVQQTAYEALFFSYGRLYQVDREAIRDEMRKIRKSNHFPARENLQTMMQDLARIAPAQPSFASFLDFMLNLQPVSQNGLSTLNSETLATFMPLFQMQSATPRSRRETASQPSMEIADRLTTFLRDTLSRNTSRTP